MKKMKGQKIVLGVGPFTGTTMWHAVERNDEERLVSQRVGLARRTVTAYICEKEGIPPENFDLLLRLLADFDRGTIWHQLADKSAKYRTFEKSPYQTELKVGSETANCGLGCDFAAIVGECNALT